VFPVEIECVFSKLFTHIVLKVRDVKPFSTSDNEKNSGGTIHQKDLLNPSPNLSSKASKILSNPSPKISDMSLH
jgi:hypothetical protein